MSDEVDSREREARQAFEENDQLRKWSGDVASLDNADPSQLAEALERAVRATREFPEHAEALINAQHRRVNGSGGPSSILGSAEGPRLFTGLDAGNAVSQVASVVRQLMTTEVGEIQLDYQVEDEAPVS